MYHGKGKLFYCEKESKKISTHQLVDNLVSMFAQFFKISISTRPSSDCTNFDNQRHSFVHIYIFHAAPDILLLNLFNKWGQPRTQALSL
jgi:hypothetical protein